MLHGRLNDSLIPLPVVTSKCWDLTVQRLSDPNYIYGQTRKYLKCILFQQKILLLEKVEEMTIAALPSKHPL